MKKFERRLEDFLGLEANSFTTDETEEERANYQQSHKFIHICDEEQRKVRREYLVDIVHTSSILFQEAFVFINAYFSCIIPWHMSTSTNPHC